MKPLKLEMTAFASYGEKQEIDFTKLSDGIYLITGETGAGKTAIFDAMMYALYGESSGSRSDKDLRSHFADSDTKTSVKFTFMQNGKVYRVERQFTINKAGNCDKDNPLLYDENDNIIAVQARKVTNKIIEIIGLDASQFKNVIMLAQGEFKKFLTSDTKEKADLLSQIFDNSLYKNFQNSLILTKDALEKERKSEYEKIESQIEYNFNDKAYGFVLLCDDEDLLEKIEGILQTDKSSLEELNSNSKNEQKAYDDILAERATALKSNDDIDLYNNALNDYDKLTAEKPAYDEKRDELNRAEKFLGNIKQPYADFNNNETQHKEAKKKYEENKRLTEEAEISLAQAKKAAEEIPELQSNLDRLKTEIGIAKSALDKYEHLDKAVSELNYAKKVEANITAKLNAVQGELNAEKSELEKCEKRLEELKDAEVLEVEAQSECTRARETLDTLKKAAGAAAEIFNGEKAIAEAEDNIRQAELDHDKKLQAYSILNANFLNAKYGIIADEIRTKLEKEEHADCPVCGSAVTRADEAKFAVVPENTPTQEQVDEASAAERNAKEEITKAEHNLKDLQKDFEFQKQKVLDLVKPYIPEFTDWERLTEDGKFKAKLKEFENAEALASKKLSQAVVNKEDKKALSDMKAKAESAIKEFAAEIEKHNFDIEIVARKIVGLNATITNLEKDLRFNSLHEAEADINQKENQADNLQKQIDTLKSAETEAQKKLISLRGESKTLKENLINASDRLREAEILLNNALEKSDYLDIEHALKDINHISIDPDEWVKVRRSEIAKYNEQLTAAKKLERELFKKLAGDNEKIPDKADLKEIDARLLEQTEKKEAAKEAAVTLFNRIEARETALEKIKRSDNKLGGTKEAYMRIKRLADIAEGKIGEKYTFERYMMSRIFEEILNAANMRLNTMSGGRYDLSPSVKGDKDNRGSLGFEIEVTDMNTGTQRSPKSLSGGETFLTSLSLALGLSDVISRKTGGNKVEAMFIDEGFGSLDPSALDTALSVLMSLTGADYQIGIISHVDKLSESIPQKIRVSQREKGSVAEIE